MGPQALRRDGGVMPSSSHRTTHLAARAGRWSAAHRKTAIAGWLAFVILAVVAGGAAGFVERGGNDGVGESGRADAALNRAFPHEATREAVLVQHPILTAHDAAFRDTVADVVRRLQATAATREVQAGRVSKDGHSQLVTFRLPGDAADSLAATKGAAAPTARSGSASSARTRSTSPRATR